MWTPHQSVMSKEVCQLWKLACICAVERYEGAFQRSLLLHARTMYISVILMSSW